MSLQVIPPAITGYFAASRSAINKAELMASYFIEDALVLDPVGSSPYQSRQAFQEYIVAVCDLFDSVGLTEEFVAIAGQEVAVKWRGDGIGKNGRQVSFEGIDIFELNPKGEIQAMRAYWHPETLLAELELK